MHSSEGLKKQAEKAHSEAMTIADSGGFWFAGSMLCMAKNSGLVYRLAAALTLGVALSILSIYSAQCKDKDHFVPVKDHSAASKSQSAVSKGQGSIGAGKDNANSSEAKVQCWVYKQKDFTAGEFTVYVSSKYARCDAMRNHGVILAQAPNWDILLYNKDGECFAVPRKIWVRDGLGSSTGDLRVYFGGLKPGDLQPTKYQGYPAVKVERDLKVDHDLVLTGSEPGGEKRRHEQRLNHVTIVAGTKALGAGPLDFYCGMLKVPPVGLPLYSLDRCEPGGVTRWSIRTISISRQELPVSFFAAPPHLKQAATIGKVIYGSATEDILLQMSGAAP